MSRAGQSAFGRNQRCKAANSGPQCQSRLLLYYSRFNLLAASSSSAFSGGDSSVVSVGLIGRPGTRYSSLVLLSKSISWHRSDQNGRQGLSSLCLGFPQVGHFSTWQK